MICLGYVKVLYGKCPYSVSVGCACRRPGWPHRESSASPWLCKTYAKALVPGMLEGSGRRPWPALIGVSSLVSRHVRPVPPSEADHDLESVLEASDAPVYNTAAVARRC